MHQHAVFEPETHRDAKSLGPGAAPRLRVVIRVAATLAATAALLTSVAMPAAYAKPAPFFYGNASHETVLSDMTTHPAAVRSGDLTWIAFQGPGYDPYIAQWDAATKTWSGPFRIGEDPLELDSHGAPALWLDPATGLLHAFWAGHASAMQHAVTTLPGSVSAWTQLPDIDAHCTYPEALTLSDGSLDLFYRDTATSAWVSRASTDGITFAAPKPVLRADPHTAWYADFRTGAAGRVNGTFVRVDLDQYNAGRKFCRFDLFYIRRDADGSWHTADGSLLPSVPVVPDTTIENGSTPTEDRCRIFDSGTGLVNEVQVREDDTGAPCILALTQTGPTITDFTWRFWRYSAGAWITTDIATADHFFDAGTFLPGPAGTIEAALVAGSSGRSVPRDNDMTGRGGVIERWTSDDRGATWERGEPATISPDDPGVPFSDPVLVQNGDPEAQLVFTDWTQDESDFWRRIFLWGDSGLVTRETSGTTERLAGPDRIATSVAVSRRAFPERAVNVVLATDRDFPDALAGAPLAAQLKGPLLLTRGSGMPKVLVDEIKRLRPTNAVIVGTAEVVSQAVVQQLLDAGVKHVDRLGGGTRYDTMLQVSQYMLRRGASGHTAVVVSGRVWADAASAASFAAANGWPIVLADGDNMTVQTRQAIQAWDATRTIIVGGTGAVGPHVEAALPGATRVAGIDRYATSAELATFSLGEGMLPDRVMVASGETFPDALCAASLGSRARAPLLLTPRSTLATEAAGFLSSIADRVTAGFVVGGTGAVADPVWAGARESARLP